jgi:hypothetical protein
MIILHPARQAQARTMADRPMWMDNNQPAPSETGDQP